MRYWLIIIGLTLNSVAFAAAPERVRIKGDSYAPFYPGADKEEQLVEDFEMDTFPVTNAKFLAFVNANPKWQRGAVKALFADASYLENWPSPSSVVGIENQPVTHVSWFAARAFCDAQGGRLPTEHEWEFVSRADETRVNATGDLAFNQKVLTFYSKPGSGHIDNINQTPANYWGLHDLYGLVWEWVEDFNSSIISSDNRQSGDKQESKFCGGAALSAANTREYATFMRFAVRSSLKSSYTLHNLGFRCAYDIKSE